MMLTHRHANRRERDTRRGLSLLDVAIGISLLAVTTVVSSRFLVSLNDGSGAALSKANARRVVTLADQAIKEDLSRITVCSVNRLGSPLFALNNAASVPPLETGVAFYSDAPDANGAYGTIDLIAWRVNGATLQRTVVTNTGVSDTSLGCETLDLTGATWTDVAEPVLAPSDSTTTFFQGVTDGVDQSYGGSCTGDDATHCDFGGIRVRFTLQPDNGSPTSFDEIYEIPSGTGRT